MQCAILAGGLGTRMLPETKRVPKALLEVAGRPFADWQLDSLAAGGVTSIVYSVGHLGEQIRDHVGDGSQFGLDVRYVFETAELLGTAGALRLAYNEGALADAFLVTYGDSFLQVDFRAVWDTFSSCADPALMTVYHNRDTHDRSNAVFSDGHVRLYRKDLVERPFDMQWIDYGLLAFRRQLIADFVIPNERSDLAYLCAMLSTKGLLAGYEADERFFEVGSPDGRRELEEHLATRARRT